MKDNKRELLIHKEEIILKGKFSFYDKNAID